MYGGLVLRGWKAALSPRTCSIPRPHAGNCTRSSTLSQKGVRASTRGRTTRAARGRKAPTRALPSTQEGLSHPFFYLLPPFKKKKGSVQRVASRALPPAHEESTRERNSQFQRSLITYWVQRQSRRSQSSACAAPAPAAAPAPLPLQSAPPMRRISLRRWIGFDTRPLVSGAL